jgi:hypothetical protein
MGEKIIDLIPLYEEEVIFRKKLTFRNRILDLNLNYEEPTPLVENIISMRQRQERRAL